MRMNPNKINSHKISYPLIFMLFLTISCSSQNQYESIAIIKYVDLNIMTPIDVSCDDFENLFGKQIESITITNQKDFDFLLNSISGLSKDENTKSADIRIKIKIKVNDIINYVICLDRFHIIKNGNYYKMSPALMQFINKKIEEQQK